MRAEILTSGIWNYHLTDQARNFSMPIWELEYKNIVGPGLHLKVRLHIRQIVLKNVIYL